MNQEIKTKWLHALTSGEYQQGTMNLKYEARTPDDTMQTQHCCLGVLCELYAAANPEIAGWEKFEHQNRYTFNLGTERKTGLPPQAVLDWAELPHSINDTINVRDSHGNPAMIHRLNDDGYTFKQIAEIIETQL